MLMRTFAPAHRQRGTTMIEVLVTFLIVTLGLLGAAGMQARLQVAEAESFQRAQAVVLLQDMVDRVNANRRNVGSYVTASPVATTSVNLCDPAPTTTAGRDLCDWQQALLGAGETRSGSNVGAMLNARGCVTVPVNTMPREVVVAVVWQGITPTLSPTSTTCASDPVLFPQSNTKRAMIAHIKIGCLQNNPTTGVCVTP